MRLTHKTNDVKTRYLPNHKKTREQINNKLGQLEDIEEEISIDLNTLLKDVHSPIDFIRKFGVSRIWYFDEGKLQKADIVNLDYNKDTLHLLTNDGWHTTRKVSDYGKTWALTKEELGKWLKQQKLDL